MTKTTISNTQTDKEENGAIVNSTQWFMISTIREKEWVVKDTLLNRIAKAGLQEQLPEVKLYELFCQKTDNKVSGSTNVPKRKTENMYPGYIFVRAKMNDQMWYLIRNTQYVTGLLGSSGKGAKPTKISNWKMNYYDKLYQTRLKNYCEEIAQKNKLVAGMLVKVIDGAYKGHFGKIYSSYSEQNICFVTIDYFGKRIIREIEIEHLEVIDS